MVHDNASNMVLDLVEDWGSLPCFGHTLQLAVNAELEIHSISRLTGVCKKICCTLQAQCCGNDTTT